MNSELEELRHLVDEMAVLWVTQEAIDLEGKDHSQAFELIRAHPRFNAMIMTAWMSGRWFEKTAAERFLPQVSQRKVDEYARRMREGIWKANPGGVKGEDERLRATWDGHADDVALAEDLAHEFGWQSRKDGRGVMLVSERDMAKLLAQEVSDGRAETRPAD